MQSSASCEQGEIMEAIPFEDLSKTASACRATIDMSVIDLPGATNAQMQCDEPMQYSLVYSDSGSREPSDSS
jgi:hypothetical protein